MTLDCGASDAAEAQTFAPLPATAGRKPQWGAGLQASLRASPPLAACLARRATASRRRYPSEYR
ncbi:hypothetical protein PZH39_16340, partial [Desulfovibrio desulfuricans]|uniref:hypothetical protein n=1 Tax=Desulfovibrio desulfuricans TaxID=876 RepID=UPI0023AF16C2